MADPFQPRFVDLVRNLSTTTGTGNFVLGAAVSGFTSFVPAVLPGESFYYSAIGIDKPAEREVGRGTMQANGTISREAISGPLTNFTPGTKSIALIAAAAWFDTVQAALGSGGGGGTGGVANRAALAALDTQSSPAILLESGREGLFKFDSSNLAAKVSADTAQGIYVAPASAPTGASGAWVRKFSGRHKVRWFGAKGDNATNDGPAFLAAIAYLKSIRLPGYGYGAGSGDLFVTASTAPYFLGTSTLDLTHTMRLIGEDMGLTGGGSTVLRWAAGTTGIRTQAYNSGGATGTRTPDADNSAGSGSTVEKLFLQGGYAGTEGEFHGIHLRGMATIRDVNIANFPGDGIHARAAIGFASIEGNVNLTRIENVTVQGCRVGIYFDSADSNACNIIAPNVIANRTWGIWDSSFLGNSYFGGHAAANGYDGALGSIPTACTYSGNRYYVLRDQAAGASTNAPSGTAADNTWWGYIGPGGTYNGIVAWLSGTTFREGGAFRTDDLNARNLIAGFYVEGDQNPAQHEGQTFVVGGFGAQGNFGGHIYSHYGAAKVPKNFIVGNDLTVDNAAAVTGTLTVTGAVSLNSSLNTAGSINSGGVSHGFGRTGGAAADCDFILHNTNYYNTLGFWSWLGGVLSVDGNILSYRGSGLYIDGSPLVVIRTAGTERGRFTASGLEITGTVTASGAVTGSNLSGANTGDQTITLTGDVTGSGTGSFAATIGANKVTFAKFVAASAASIVGATAAGNFAELTPASARSVLGLAAVAISGSATDLTSGTLPVAQTPAFSGGDVTKAAGSGTQTIANGAVTLAKQANLAGNSIIGNNTGSAATPIALTAAQTKTLLAIAASDVSGLAAIATSGSGADLAAASVTYAKLQNVSATSRLLGRASAGAGVVEELGLAGGLTISGANLTLGAITPTGVASTGAVTSSSPTAGNGYASGAGGAATQATSKSTAVTLNTVCGAITMSAAALAASTNVTFTLTNSAIAATDVMVVSIKSGSATAGTYQAWVSGTAAGSCTITVRNISAGSLSEALVLNFAVNKAVIA